MRPNPYAVVFTGVLFSSLSSILVRLSVAPPLVIAAYRMVFSVLLLLPLVLVQRRTHRKETCRIATRDLLLSVLSGVFLALHLGTWITSLTLTTVASSVILVTTHPLIVALVGFLVLGERLSWKSVLLMLAALCGSAILVVGQLGSGTSTFVGNLLAFAGAIAVSGYMILGRVVRQRITATQYTLVAYSVAAVCLGIGAVALNQPVYPYPLREFVIFAALALFCQLLGHSLFNWAVKFVRPTLISTSILGEPVIATSLALFIFGEVPGSLALIGGVVILVSIFVFIRNEGRTDPS